MYERDLLDPLLRWLRQTRRVRSGTLCVEELHWMGRWVDFATLTASGSTTAYELKLRHNLRAIDQAAKNSYSFRRSYVVTATAPSTTNIELASHCGVGIIVVRHGRVVLQTTARPSDSNPDAAQRLRRVLAERGEATYVQ